MKALVVRRPWAELIARGTKDVENRGRNTSHRGPLLIVAGQTWDPAGVEYAAMLGLTIPDTPGAYPTGAVVLVDLTGVCSAAHEGHACACSLWGVLGQHHWQLANPWQLTKPVPVRGMPGMFNPPGTVIDAVVAQLAEETR